LPLDLIAVNKTFHFGTFATFFFTGLPARTIDCYIESVNNAKMNYSSTIRKYRQELQETFHVQARELGYEPLGKVSVFYVRGAFQAFLPLNPNFEPTDTRNYPVMVAYFKNMGDADGFHLVSFVQDDNGSFSSATLENIQTGLSHQTQLDTFLEWEPSPTMREIKITSRETRYKPNGDPMPMIDGEITYKGTTYHFFFYLNV